VLCGSLVLQGVDDMGLHAKLAHHGRYRVPEVVRRNRGPDTAADTSDWHPGALEARTILPAVAAVSRRVMTAALAAGHDPPRFT
jgi:hypothetical protein